MTQQHGYLNFNEDKEFRAHAKNHALYAAALGRLLIVRELKLRRLPSLLAVYSGPSRPPRRKITVHFSNTDLKEAFEERAAEAGVSVSVAAAALFRAELAERWLSRAVVLDST